MKLWLVEPIETPLDPDDYYGAVVVAETAELAKKVFPDTDKDYKYCFVQEGETDPLGKVATKTSWWYKYRNYPWKSKDVGWPTDLNKLKVRYLGEADSSLAPNKPVFCG